MLTYSFENIGASSLYGHLYEVIKRDIIDGTLPADYKLPSKRSFSKNLGVSIITVENAYAQLIAEGYIYSIPKKGYYVARLEGIILQEKTHASLSQDMCMYTDALLTEETLSSPLIADFTSNSTSREAFPFAIWAKLMRDVLSDMHDKLMTSTPGIGSYELRSAIAAHLQDFRGMRVQPGQIVIGAGTEYLYSIIIQLLGRNLTYAVEDPGYKKISRIYESNDINVCHVPVTKSGVDAAALEASGADVIHLSPSHHFPTGIVTPISTRYELLGWAAKSAEHERYIIEDDYDSEFRLMGRPIPALKSIDVLERVIYMNSFSKSLASTIRISYMVLPPHLMERYNRLLSFYACTVSTFEQYTLARFISEGYFEKHINRMRNHYRNVRNLLVKSIRQSRIAPLCEIREDDAGLHFLLRVDTDVSDSCLKKTLLGNGIRISCLSDYYHFSDRAKEHILIVNYSCLDETIIPSAVAALEKSLS